MAKLSTKAMCAVYVAICTILKILPVQSMCYAPIWQNYMYQ